MWVLVTRTPFTKGPFTSQEAHRHLILQDVPGALSTHCHCHHFGTGHPGFFWVRKAEPFDACFSCLYCSLDGLAPPAISAATAASHSQTPQRADVLGQSRLTPAHPSTPGTL